jgi:uncharacterized membrane protein YkoI
MTPTRKLGLGGFLLAGAVAGGISLASLNTANAASATTPTAVAATDDGSTASTDTSATATDPAPAGPHTANGITETVLSGDDATKVQAAVAAAYPDATIVRMETDADGDTYEAHVTMADGSEATVKLDASFAVTSTETGGPGGHGGGRGGGPHSANGITETVLTGDDATKVQAAVLAANPGATIDRMETDADGDTYEAHVTLADGSQTTVKLDASFNVTSTEAGR